MFDENDNPRPDLPLSNWDGLDKLGEPALPVLAKFVHECSQDPNERTLAVTVLVTTMCQLTGRRMMPRVPSMIVINARDLVPDPIDLLAGFLVPEPSAPESGLCRHPGFLGGAAKHAPWAMAQAIEKKNKLGGVVPLNADTHQGWEDRFFAAQAAGFGSGPGRGYAEAWHDTFGLMTARGNELILRIDSPEDRLHFCRDVVKGARRLREPLGYGPDLTLVPKHICVSGSLPAWDWNAALATKLVELGQPLLMLPSLAKSAPVIANDTILKVIAHCIPLYYSDPVEEPANLIQDSWFGRYEGELRSRLRHLPATYEYAMQKLARQLLPACLRIANWCGTHSGSSTEEIWAMTRDLCGHSLRGLVIGVAGLAWHGLGFEAGCPHATVVRVLEYLRARKPMTKSDLLRGTHIEMRERDRLLEQLEAENLVRIDGKMVAALSYPEFVEALYSRKAFPHPVNHWARLPGKDQSA
ncbi:MAG: hypothetical protein KFF45_07190, partial [Thioalkalivibrio sp.]|nr:hypothetical protein [Thioalkalivibrio sp.]